MAIVQQLHDIHMPDPISIWPWAIGWWLLLFGILITMILGWKTYRLWSQMRIKRIFLQQLGLIKQQYEEDQNAAVALQSLNLLLKKATLYFYPREEVASLYGERWMNFLLRTSKKLDVTGAQYMFSEKLYQQQIQVDITPGLMMVKRWIEQQRKPCMN